MNTLSLNQSKLLVNALDPLFRFDDVDVYDRVIVAARTIIGCEFVSVDKLCEEGSLHAVRVDPPDLRSITDDDIDSRLVLTHPLWPDFVNGKLTIPRKISDKVSLTQFEDTPIYCERYRAVKLSDQIVVLIELSRKEGVLLTVSRVQKCFSEDDRKLLTVLGPFLRQAHNHAEALKRIGGLLGLIDHMIRVEDKPIIYFTTGLTNLVVSESARILLRKYFADWSELTESLPEDVVRWIRREESRAKAVDNIHPPSGPLRISAESSALTITLHADREQRLLIVEEQIAAAPWHMLIDLGLTRREAEVLFWASEGKTNLEIGILCGISARTVQKHIEHIYQKVGVETRIAAVKAAFEAMGQFHRSLKPAL